MFESEINSVRTFNFLVSIKKDAIRKNMLSVYAGAYYYDRSFPDNDCRPGEMQLLSKTKRKECLNICARAISYTISGMINRDISDDLVGIKKFYGVEK